jgi:hypothetical protein
LWTPGFPQGKNTIFCSKSFFKKSKMDIYFCPFLEILKDFWKMGSCDHNEKLASQRKKNNLKFVTIIFFILGAVYLGVFFVL